MGKKISIDSATMMNKVFEIIEAKKIFNIDLNKLNIIIHPKSYVHAIICFNNGLYKILAHDTNMEIPIANSLDIKNEHFIYRKSKIDFNKLNHLNFSYPDIKKFPVLSILKIVPKNTHEWGKFIKPNKLKKKLLIHDFSNIRFQGVLYNFFMKKWSYINSEKINYLFSSKLK